MASNIASLMPLSALIVLLIALFVIEPAPFSIGAFTQPYLSADPIPSLVLGAIGLAYAAIYPLFLFPLYSKQKGGEMPLFAMSQTPGIIGFVIGFLARDPWAALPFFALSLCLYVFAYTRLASGRAES